MILRPFGFAEWLYTGAGAALLAATQLVPLGAIGAAVIAGSDVYLFLAGMMLLAECARVEGVFDWIAAHALRAARGRQGRLFPLVYAAGTLITIVLSNDATAVVLTPAIAAVMRRTDSDPLPYVFICALVANAASFVLPISNPANLVIFGSAIPALGPWLRNFFLPSIIAIAATYAALRLLMHKPLARPMLVDAEPVQFTQGGKIAFAGILSSAAGLVVASAFHCNLGATIATFGCATGVVIFVHHRAHGVEAIRSVSWSVLLLVAALFILVRAADDHGLRAIEQSVALGLAHFSPLRGVFGASLLCAFGGNLINNLPAGLIAASGLAAIPQATALHAAVAVGIDLGPNLSVTGSLATVLWLIVLRREKIEISAWKFLSVGAIAMPCALIPATAALLFGAR